jgi:D-glycero-D-manno-heptose 1,7-bisphosphate phosphatase
MKPAVFLDRDGVLNPPIIREGRPYPPVSAEEFTVYPEAREACRLLKEAGFTLVVATNQPDVGRGTLARSAVEGMHAKLRELIPELDRVEVSYAAGQEPAGTPPDPDRKPRPGMLLRAARELGLDLAASYMVGDRWRDIDCGVAAGCRTVFIDRGYVEELRARPDYVCADVLDAALWVLGSEILRERRVQTIK